MAHTEGSIMTEIKAAFENPTTLYDQDVVKRAGDDQRYSEIAARKILQRYKNNEYIIKPVYRTEGYYVADHAERAKIENRPEKYNKEKWDARLEFYRKQFNDIGEIIDYETPLYTSGMTSRRAVDLLAYNSEEEVLTILEYKIKENKEPLLRCVLEAYTYLRLVEMDRTTLLKDFKRSPFAVSEKSEIRAAVFVHKDSKPYEHFHQAENTEIRKLMRELQVGFFSIEDNCLMEV